MVVEGWADLVNPGYPVKKLEVRKVDPWVRSAALQTGSWTSCLLPRILGKGPMESILS